MKYFVLMLLFLALPLSASAEVEVVSLKHRSAAELAASVRELLDEGEKVQPAGDHLVLVADGESLHAALKLIELLDRQLVNLMIRVRQSEDLQRAGKDLSTSVRYSSKEGVSSSASAAYRLGNASTETQQTLYLVEGGQGFIEVARDVPFTDHWAAVTGDVSGYSESTTYKKIATGFWISPQRLDADQVMVEVAPYFSDLESSAEPAPQLMTAQLKSRLQVPLGQWFPLGSQMQNRDRLSRAIISWKSSSGQSDRTVEIRIDRVE